MCNITKNLQEHHQDAELFILHLRHWVQWETVGINHFVNEMSAEWLQMHQRCRLLKNKAKATLMRSINLILSELYCAVCLHLVSLGYQVLQICNTIKVANLCYLCGVTTS